ncbi:serine hydrolase domain-containing protein [Streptomyces sp. BPTC-684]|uniref:serine hydrolase domain-containing protein n=1 Tax=Streptomyces sp. BPTC-684 TaxID=3043734 RepID=UPI0024B22C05|nr:serine hydrolase domain-containing protein [Streptomyces sp. BPTC-684]WHM40220.1 serine hydrolase domain-containing protein [Streptomyces sp. BPTC-684]
MADGRLRNAAQTRVEEILDEVTASGEETGVQVAAYLDGELVVDAWAGLADVERGRPMEPETLVPSWSTGKGIAAALVAVLVDRGMVGYDTPIAAHWPEFAARGKSEITLGQVLSHSAGLPQLRPEVTPEELFDVASVGDWLAGQAPLWEPGTANGYHGWTYGVLLAETLRRATGRTCDELLREELAGPLGVAESLLFSVPDDLVGRVATCYDGGWSAYLDRMPPDSPFFTFAPRPVLPVAALANRADFRRAALPANGTMTARAAARVYAALVCGELDGIRLVSDTTLKEATTARTSGEDRSLGFLLVKGYGFMLGGAGSVVRSPDGGFGTNGSGGSAASADPAHRFSFAVTKNRMSVNGLDRRLFREVRGALGIGGAPTSTPLS